MRTQKPVIRYIGKVRKANTCSSIHFVLKLDVTFSLRRVEIIVESDNQIRRVRMPFWPSVRPRGTARFPLTYFSEIYVNIFRKSAEKFQVSLKSDRNNGYVT
jgi:hypothetical protein